MTHQACIQAAKEKDAEISHRGRYVLRVDASEALHPYDTSVSVAPELTSLAMEDVVQIPVLDDTTATIGCELPALAQCRATSCWARLVTDRASNLESWPPPQPCSS